MLQRLSLVNAMRSVQTNLQYTAIDEMDNFTIDEFDSASTIRSVGAKIGFGLAVNVLCNCYILPVVCGVGILGNIANLITLASPKLRAVSYMYLRALGVADLLCMFSVLIFVFFEIMKLFNWENIYGHYVSAWYRAHTMLPLINASVSAGILIVVALTVERYISICWPIFFRQWNSLQKAVPLIVVAYVLPILVYIPMCWQMEVVEKIDRNYSDGTIIYNVVDNKKLLYSGSYQAYKWTRETVLKFIPIVTLAVLNLLIVLAFGKFRDRRKRLSTTNSSSFNSNASGTSLNRHHHHQQHHQSLREQRNLLFLLIAIAVMFFICNTPAAINLLFISEEKKKLPGYLIFRSFANFMEITNHAVNFYIFCLCSRDYRKTFIYTFPCVKKVSDGTAVVKRRLSETVTKMQTNVIESGRIITVRRGSKCVDVLTNGLCNDFQGRLRLIKGSVYLYPINEEDFESDVIDDEDESTGDKVGQYVTLSTSQSAFSPSIEDGFADDEDTNA